LSKGDYLYKDQVEECFCVSFVLVYCFYVLVLGPAHYISYSYVYAESDVKHQPTNLMLIEAQNLASDVAVMH